jgi:hypothetical protein
MLKLIAQSHLWKSLQIKAGNFYLFIFLIAIPAHFESLLSLAKLLLIEESKFDNLFFSFHLY